MYRTIITIMHLLPITIGPPTDIVPVAHHMTDLLHPIIFVACQIRGIVYIGQRPSGDMDHSIVLIPYNRWNWTIDGTGLVWGYLDHCVKVKVQRICCHDGPLYMYVAVHLVRQ